MIKYLLLSWWILSLPAWSQEKTPEITAYHIGHGSIEAFRNELALMRDGEPVRKAPHSLLEAPLFESRFFNKGDELVDCSALLKAIGIGMAEPIVAIFNRSTRKMVVKGSVIEQMRCRMFFLERSRLSALEIEGVFYEIPVTKVGLHRWSPQVLPKGAKELARLSSVSRGRSRCVLDQPALEFESILTYGELDEWIEVDLSIKGTILDGQTFSLDTSITLWPESPELMEIGTLTPDGPVLALRLVARSVYYDGTPRSEWVLFEKPEAYVSPKPLIDLEVSQAHEILASDGDRKFHVDSVPPAALRYLMKEDEEEDSSSDPFAEDEPESEIEEDSVKVAAFIFPVDPRIPRSPRTCVMDLSEIIKEHGIVVREGDFVIFSPDEGRMYSLLPESESQRARAIWNNFVYDPPWVSATSLTLIESETEPTLRFLAGSGFRQISRMAWRSRSGRRLDLTFTGHGQNQKIEAELVVEDAHSEVYLTLGDEDNITIPVKVQHDSPILLHKKRHGDKWRAFVLETRNYYPGDERSPKK